ncbi:hypothetical protein [Bradyrhizobium sp. USDA 3315]
MIFEVEEITRVKAGLKFVGRVGRILGTDSERMINPDVAENGMANVWIQLMQVLMGGRILAQFREHVCGRERDKTLKFVDVYEVIAPSSRRKISTRVRRKPDHGGKEPTKQGRAIISDSNLCEIYDEDPSMRWPSVAVSSSQSSQSA